jgi:hypothetical protein
MTRKIPVGATIAHAYRFAFRQFLAIAGIMWASYALILLLAFLSRDSFAALSQASATRNMALMQGHWAPLLLHFLVSFLLVFIQMTGLTQFALGERRESPWFYFSLGRPVWRLVGAVFLAVLAIAAVAVCYGLAVLILGLIASLVLTSAAGKLVLAFLALLALLGFYGGFIFLLIRFTFLLAPVTIAEQRISVFRAWSLTHRNFWRMFLIVLSLVLPMIAIQVGGMMMLAGPMPLLPKGAAPEQLAAFHAARAAWQLGFAAKLHSLWFIFYPVSGILYALFYGASCAAQVFAYRKLTENEGLSPIAGD